MRGMYAPPAMCYLLPPRPRSQVDVHHRCCSKHKQRFISSLTINTCCRKHKVETCERIVQVQHPHRCCGGGGME